MSRFLRDSTKLNISNEDIKLLESHIPTKKIWVDKYEHTRTRPNYWYNHHPNKRNIRHVRADMAANPPYGGQLGIRYQEVDKVVPKSDSDWTSFIKEKSDGLTKLGQKYLQQAVESFVYSVLGAQARTRWSIVNGGAKSLQTQDVFRKVVQDSIKQDDVTVGISNMRQAISNTNVVLNMAISPGIILVPSDMIIVKKKIPGYNNILTLATGDMKFGTNLKVNAPPPVIKPIPRMVGLSPKVDTPVLRKGAEPVIDLPVEPRDPIVKSTSNDFEEYIIAGVIISLVSRYLIRFVV